MYVCVSLSKGEYEIVANDYDKAKTLFADTKVSIFKKGNPHCSCRAYTHVIVSKHARVCSVCVCVHAGM